MNRKLAGSAITQGVGRITEWETWAPTTNDVAWLLIGGHPDPPTCVMISDRRPRDKSGQEGSFSDTIRTDFFHLENALRKKNMPVFNTCQNIKRSETVVTIMDFFRNCNNASPRRQPIIYYSGHGEVGTGNWCFGDGTLTIHEIDAIVPRDCFHPIIISDSCYSGHWSNYCLNKGLGTSEGFYCLSACPEYSTAYDVPTFGGELTCFITGKEINLQREPLWSGNTRCQAPLSTKDSNLDYTCFMRGVLTNNLAYPITQTIVDGKLSVVIGYCEKPRDCCWATIHSIDEFKEKIAEQKSNSRNVQSIASDKNQLVVYFSDMYGGEQNHIITKDITSTVAQMGEAWNEEKMITSVTSFQSYWIITMTANTPEYDCSNPQTYFTGYTWSAVVEKISEKQEDDYVITGLCYNSVHKVYLCVMTYDVEACMSNCFTPSELVSDVNDWIDEQFKDGYYVTHLFHDPTNDCVHVITSTNEMARIPKSYYFNVSLIDLHKSDS